MVAVAKPEATIVKREATPSERFTAAVQRQFAAEVGNLNFSAYEKTLAQHLFIKIDAALIEAETKRKDSSKPAVTWANVNMTKIAIDAVNRVQLGIDALIPGSLYPITYLNDRTKKYDVDLRVGYKGEMYYKCEASVKPVKNVRVELVYTTDNFTVYKAGLKNSIEGYDFEITQPFDRGEIVGGFGYIEYLDGTDNVLVTISKAEIDKYRGKAMGDKFWGEWYAEMAYKTIVHRLMSKIVIDPAKVNAVAMAKVDAEDGLTLLHDDLMDAPPVLPADAEPIATPDDSDGEVDPYK